MRKELGYSHQYFIMCSAKLVRDKLVMTLYRKSLFGFYETIYRGGVMMNNTSKCDASRATTAKVLPFDFFV